MHAAYALGYEAGINKNNIDGNMIPFGALVTLVQKGIQYIELDANLDDSVDSDDDFSFLQPLDVITKDVRELQKIIREKKQLQNERDKVARERKRDRDILNIEKDTEQKREQEKEKQHEEHGTMDISKNGEDKGEGRLDETGDCGGPEPMDTTPSSLSVTHEILSSDVTILQGHSSEVFVCAWSPTDSLLASGSGDSTARIWKIPDGPCGSSMQILPPNVHILEHFMGRFNAEIKDVITLDWNQEGTLLATGSADGLARIWNKDGQLKKTLIKHRGAIYSLKWNKKGDYLLSGSFDNTAIVWDMKTWDCKQQFKFHSAQTVDVDWRNNISFATCSTDNMIYVCSVGENQPIKAFSGHQGEVNTIKWDATGSLLASCSDDRTAKIWSLKQDKCVHDFKEHNKEIYTIRWSPSGLGTNNPNQQLKLASASYDSTVKLWEVERGSLLYSLNGHLQPVYCIAFSPNGEYLASGSRDHYLHIWSVKEGKIVKTYHGGGTIYDVCWNQVGDRVAACLENKVVCVMDFRK